jgi:hypothetical protein
VSISGGGGGGGDGGAHTQGFGDLSIGTCTSCRSDVDLICMRLRLSASDWRSLRGEAGGDGDLAGEGDCETGTDIGIGCCCCRCCCCCCCCC